MSAIIKLRDTDKRIQLVNSQILRPLSFGTDWTKLRIALRMTASTDPGISVAGPVLAFGVCGGTTNGFGSSTTTNFVGISPAPAAGFTYAASPNRVNFRVYPTRRVGTTLTQDTSSSNSQALPCDPTAHVLFFIDITKGAPNYLTSFFLCEQSVSFTDITQAQFFTYSEMVSPVGLAGYAYRAGAALAASEVAGPLDTLNISNGFISLGIEISDLAVIRMA
jgi:hypothetical protein